MISEENELSESTESKTKALVVITGKQQKEIAALLEVAPSGIVPITSNEEYTAAGARLVLVNANLKQLEAVHEDIGGPLARSLVDIKTSVKKLAAFFDVPKRKLEQAKADIKAAMNTYLQAEEAKRAAAQKLLDDAAAKEKARIKALADEAARKSAIAAKVAKDAADKAAREGRAEQAKKQAEVAAKIEAQASVRRDIADAKIASLDAPKVAMEAPKAAGTTSRQTWTFQVTDTNLVPDSYWILDVAALRRAVASGARDIPGVSIFPQNDIVTTGK